MSHVEKGVLLTVKPLDFVARDTGETFQGVKIFLCRPVTDPRYEGWGMHVYFLRVPGPEGLKLAETFNQQASGLYMRSVEIDCDLRQMGKNWQPVPNHIRAA